ncbi:MAG TPA: PAS domain S-box protein [Pyrinomonadaceae bacterium]
MNIREFLDAVLSSRATRLREAIGVSEGAARKWTGRSLASIRSSSTRKSDAGVIVHGEGLFSTFMDHLPAYAWIKNLDGRYVYVNERVRQLALFQSGHLGKTDGDLWPSERAAAYRESDLRVAANGEKFEALEWFPLNGERRYVLVTKFPITDENGTIIMVGGTSVDITEQKRVEEALRQSESFRRMIIESEPECVKVVAPDYSLLDMNPAGLRMIGALSREQVVGQSVLDLIAAESRSTFMNMHQRVCQGESVVTEFEIVGLDGSRRWMESHAAPLLDREFKVIAQLAITRDVTERRRAEDRLRRNERELAEAQRIAHIGSWSWDLSGKTQSWSDELYRIYGLRRGTAASTYKTFREVIHPEDRLLVTESVERAIRTCEPIDIHFRIVRPDGEERILHSQACIEYDDQGIPIRKFGTAQDVTEQRRADEALRQAEQKYRDIVENAAEGIFQTTPDGRFLSANPALVKMFGFNSAEELIRERADISNEHYVDPKRREEFKRQLEEHGVVKGFEFEAYRKDGSVIWLCENVRAVRDENGKVLYYEGTTQDITERRKADHSLRLFRTLMDRSTDAIEVLDPNTLSFLHCNKSAYESLGYTREEFLGLSAYDIDPNVNQELNERLQAEMSKSDSVTFESVHRRKDGSTFPVEINLKTVCLERDYRLAVVRDITERKLAEEALRHAEQKYRELFENAQDATYVHDLKGTYTSINLAAEKLTGYSRQEILGKDFSSFVAPEYVEQVRENLCRKLREQGETTYEVEVITKNGQRVPVEVSSRLIYKEGVPVGVQGTARNIAERKRAEEALRGFSRQLIQAQEAERESIARELHDQIGQLLTAIQINLKTIRDSKAEGSALLLNEGVTLVDKAIQQVRDLSFELRPSLLDDLGLTAALQWYTDHYRQRTGIQTTTSISPESRNRLPRELETSCFRIVQEALTNVARHAQAKNVAIDVRTGNGELSLSIKDDGMGFNSYAATNGMSPNSLGLRGMEERVRSLGGKLEILSAPSEGTEVRVYFPNGTKQEHKAE